MPMSKKAEVKTFKTRGACKSCKEPIASKTDVAAIKIRTGGKWDTCHLCMECMTSFVATWAALHGLDGDDIDNMVVLHKLNE